MGECCGEIESLSCQMFYSFPLFYLAHAFSKLSTRKLWRQNYDHFTNLNNLIGSTSNHTQGLPITSIFSEEFCPFPSKKTKSFGASHAYFSRHEGVRPPRPQFPHFFLPLLKLARDFHIVLILDEARKAKGVSRVSTLLAHHNIRCF